MKMETLQQRRDELERKEQQLKESLLKFDKFLKVWLPLTVCIQRWSYYFIPQLSCVARRMI